MRDLLSEFCSIDSATLNKAGVNRMQERVAALLSGMGFKLKMLKSEERFSHLIVAERAGRSPKFITLITHSDTVLANFRELAWKDDQGFGSGVIDNKGGLAVGLMALQRLLSAEPQLEYSLRFVCSPNEEMGSIGFVEKFREMGKDTIVALGLEPALDNGSIIHERRGNRWYDIEVVGREAHAGRSYGAHANAAHDLAAKIVRLAALTNYRKNMAVNVGHFEGGRGRHNVICGKATAKLDVRFASMDQRDWLHRKIEKILSKPREKSVDGQFVTETSFDIVDDCPPFSLTRRSRGMAREYAAIVSRLEGRKVVSAAAGGAGDVNYLSTRENFVLDGLGPVGGEMHTPREFVRASSLETRTQALAEFLGYLMSRTVN